MPQSQEDIAKGGDSGKALVDGVKAGVAAAGTGAAVAGAAAGIGAAVGASFGPFAVVAAPLGAAIGALIGFFVGLVKATPSKEEIERARAAQEAARLEAANKGWVLSAAAKTLPGYMMLHLSDPDPMATFNRLLAKSEGAAASLRAIAKKNPAYQPLIDNLITGVREALKQPTPLERERAMQRLNSTVAIFNALGSLPGNLQSDPFAYFRQPLLDVMRPAFAAAGIDLNDPTVLARIRGNYDMGAAMAARPRPQLGALPIRRRSVGLASGGRVAVDTRAFSPKLAPYGVGSFKLFPDSVPQGESWRAGDDKAGFALQSPWPYGLDQDRFALPPSSRRAAAPQRPAGQATSIPAPVSAAALVGLLWWLL